MLFDYFYFINGGFPTTNEQMFVPRAKLPLEVNGEELNTKKLYEKFRGSDSHEIVCSQFLAALFLFFNGGGEEKARKFLSEFCQNLTVGALSTDHSFQFDAITDLLTSLSFLFRQLAMTQTETLKAEDIKTDQQLKQKYEIDDDDPPPPPYNAAVYTDPQSVSKKIREFDRDVAKPKLETPKEIKQNDKEGKFDKVWLDIFLNGVKTTKQVLQELNDQAIDDFLSEEVMVPKAETDIDPIFIDDDDDDDDDIFAKDDLTNENKEFIKNLLDRSNYNSIFITSDKEEDTRQDLIQSDLFNKDLVGADMKTDYDIPLFDKPIIKIEPTTDVVPKEDIDLPTIDKRNRRR